MKRIISILNKIALIVMLVVMLFSICEKKTDSSVEESVQTQVAPAEEFDGITFGMTKEEVITIIGREPDNDYESDIKYKNQIFLGIVSYDTDYDFDENGNLDSIFAFYNYYDESEKEQAPIDLEYVKEELFKYYPENTITRINEYDNETFWYTEKRMICLETYDHAFSVYITIRDSSK